MKKSLLLISTLLLLTSCGGSNEDDYYKDYYIFQDIEYRVESDDGIRKKEIVNTISEGYENETNENIIVTFDPYKDLKDTSLFKVGHKPNYSYQQENLPKIGVPIIINDKNSVITGEKKWVYLEEKITTTPCEYTSGNKYTIYPNNKLTFKYQIPVEEITVSYTATYIGQESGRLAKVTGKWKGNRIKEGKLEVTQETIQ